MTQPIEARSAVTKDTRSATEDLRRRVQGEFLEMPGLRVTEVQARRLWGLDAGSCSAVLGAWLDARFLFRTRDGAFMRIEHATSRKALREQQPLGTCSNTQVRDKWASDAVLQNATFSCTAIIRGELSPPSPTPSNPVGSEVVEVSAPKPVCVPGSPGIPATELRSAKFG